MRLCHSRRRWPSADRIILSHQHVTSVCDSFLLSGSHHFTGLHFSLHFLVIPMSDNWEWSLCWVLYQLSTTMLVLYNEQPLYAWRNPVTMTYWVCTEWQAGRPYWFWLHLLPCLGWSGLEMMGHLGPGRARLDLYGRVRTGKTQSL